MTRSVDDRIADVRRLLAAAGEIHAARATMAARIAASTGLTPEGVELGFASLEVGATDTELRALVAAAGDTAHVHVILSANVFVAPLRAIALARAAAPQVTVRASPRDPVLAEALVAAAGDPGIVLVGDRDVTHVAASEVHVYGRDETVAAVQRSLPAGVRLRGHGSGMGVAVVGHGIALAEAAEGIALDVAAFDQRGCLSPRAVFVAGGQARADAFADAIHGALEAYGERVPRGMLLDEERSWAARWRNVVTFAGRLRTGKSHAIALVPSLEPELVPPPGRHLAIVPIAAAADLDAALAAVSRYVVALGSDEPLPAGPSHARRSRLGTMQRPPLDGPVDRRST